jgi:hypothetical protein
MQADFWGAVSRTSNDIAPPHKSRDGSQFATTTRALPTVPCSWHPLSSGWHGRWSPSDAAVDKLVRRARDAGAKIIIEAGSQKWGYAGAFADPDGHMWQVSRADGFLTR